LDERTAFLIPLPVRYFVLHVRALQEAGGE
jgi:hypothetical protein